MHELRMYVPVCALRDDVCCLVLSLARCVVSFISQRRRCIYEVYMYIYIYMYAEEKKSRLHHQYTYIEHFSAKLL